MANETMDAMVSTKFQNRLKHLRVERKLKQGDLAIQTQINRATLSLIENHRLFLSAKNALVLRDVLKCSLDDLYERIS